MKLNEIARRLPAKLVGDALLDIRRAVHPADAEARTDLAVLLSKEALATGLGAKAGAVLIGEGTPPPEDGRSVLVYAGNERAALAALTALFDPGPAHGTGVHPTAAVAPDAKVAPSAAIGPHSVVGAKSTIGEGTTLIANVTIGAGVSIGKGCLFHPGVVINDRVEIGDRVTIHPNAVIGGDGFSFIPARTPGGATTASGLPTRIHSIGTVVIGDDVEIGAGTTIDRATLRTTRIGRGTKIDNQVQIGHNVTIGEGCLICGQSGIAGSVEIGDRVLIAAGTGVSDHVKIGNDAVVLAMSGVGMDIRAEAMVLGIPAVPLATWKERYMQTGRLKMLRKQVADLKTRLETMEKATKGVS